MNGKLKDMQVLHAQLREFHEAISRACSLDELIAVHNDQ
jgi:hypothetical protein